MLKDLFPKAFKRYSALPILGSILDKFSRFTLGLGYQRVTVRDHLKTTPIIDKHLRRLKCHSATKITRAMLLACAPEKAKESSHLSAAVKLLEKYFDRQKIFPPVSPSTPIEEKLDCYSNYLRNIR